MNELGALADSSAIIYLAKVGALNVAVEVLGRLRIVPAVWVEAVERGEQRGKEDPKWTREASEMGLLHRISIGPRVEKKAMSLIKEFRLGHGEAQILALARRSELVLMDDVRGSRVGHGLGLRPRSTSLLPLIGLENGVLDRGTALDLLERLSLVTTIRADVLRGVKTSILEKK